MKFPLGLEVASTKLSRGKYARLGVGSHVISGFALCSMEIGFRSKGAYEQVSEGTYPRHNPGGNPPG